MDSLEGKRFTIGRFAGITGISANTLRRYDRDGLLSPAFHDPDTGYRSYTIEQLDAAILIRLLRDLDLPLADVRTLVAGADPDRLQALLREHRANLIERRAALDHILMRIDTTLADGRGLLPYELEAIELQPQAVVSRRFRVTHAQLDEMLDRETDDFEDELAARGGRAEGREIVLYHNVLQWYPDLEVEICLPVVPEALGEAACDDAEAGGPPAWELAGGPALRSVYHGSWEQIWHSYALMMADIVQRGFDLSGPARETYLADERDTDDPEQYITQIIWPVKPFTTSP